MSKAHRLHSLYATSTLPPELWKQFTDKAGAAGYGPTAALARLIRRYLARGFDDGAPERLAGDRPPSSGG